MLTPLKLVVFTEVLVKIVAIGALKQGCSGIYLPQMGWEVGSPKVLGPTKEYKPEYVTEMSQQQFARAQNAIPSRYPISAMRHAFTMDPKIICNAHMGRGGLADCPPLWTDSAFSRCLVCGNSNNYDMTGRQCGGQSSNNWQCTNAGNKWEILPPGRKLDLCPLLWRQY